MICPYCGFQNNEKAVFCSNCGKSFSDNLNEVGFEKRIPALPKNKLRPCLIIVSGIIFLCLGVIILGVLAASRSNLFNQPLSEEILQQTNEISTTTFQDSTNEAQIENVSPSPTNVPLQETPTFESLTAFTATELYPGYDPNDPYAGPIPEGALYRIGRGKINDCAISPDENEIILATDLGVYIYDYESFELIWFYETESTCTEVIHHPVQNIFAAGLGDGEILLFDREKKELIKTLVGHEYGGINELLFSPDGEYLVSSAYHGGILIFDVQFGKIVSELSGDQFKVSPNWKWIVYKSGMQILLGDIETGKEVKVLEELTDFYTVFSATFSLDGKHLALEASSLTIWNLETLDKELIFDSSSERIDSIMYFPDGSLLLACMADGTLNIYDTKNGTIKNSFDTIIRTFYYKGDLVVFSDWKTILLPYDDGQIMLLDLQLGQIKELIPENYQDIKSIELVKNETQVLIFFSEMIVSLDLETGQIIHQLNGHSNYSSVYSGNNHSLSIWTTDDKVKVWDVETMSWTEIYSIEQMDKASLILSSENELQIIEYLENKLNVWDVKANEILNTIEGKWSQLSYIPKSNSVLIYDINSEGRASVWDLTRGEQIIIFDEPYTLFTPSTDGKYFVSGSGNSKIYLWDAHTGEKIGEFKSDSFVEIGTIIIGAMQFSPDNLLVAIEDRGDGILLWNIESKELLSVIEASDNNCYYLHNFYFHPLKPFIAAVYDDNKIGIWNIETGEKILSMEDSSRGYGIWGFLQDGEILVLSNGGTLTFWDVSFLE